MLGRVVEHIAEDLLHALAVCHDRRHILVRALVADLDALLPEELEIGVDCVLELAGKIDALHAQREAPVLHLREFEQLLDHRIKAVRLGADDREAAAVVFIRWVVDIADRLDPSPDGGQRRAQLVADR